MNTPLTDKIKALTTLINTTTEIESSTLSDAVQHLINGQGQIILYDTVVLDTDHTSVAVGNPVYWRTFLKIPEEDILNGDIFFIDISNNKGYVNKSSIYYVGSGFYFYNSMDNSIDALFSRANNTAGTRYRTDYYAFANAGTIFKIYKISFSNIELYSIGTDIITRYIGRNLTTGRPNWTVGVSNATTGEYKQDSAAADPYGISMNYIPVKPEYTFLKTGNGFIYHVHCYDKNLQWIACTGPNAQWNIWKEMGLPQGTQYIRLATHTSNDYNQASFIRVT